MTVKFTGGPELLRMLEQLPIDLEKKALRRALRQGANVIRDEARLKVRKKSGALARSIKTETNAKAGTITAKVRLSGKHAHLGRWLEYGVAAHAIAVRDAANPPSKLALGTINKKAKRGELLINGEFAGQLVMHPGIAPMPFLRPAADAKQSEVVAAIGESLRAYLQFGRINAGGISNIEAD